MVKEAINDRIRLGKDNRALLEKIVEITDDYMAQGYVMTLRQLYYQLVSRGIIPNKQSEYAKLSKILKEGRMSGTIDWEIIEDRLRRPKEPNKFTGVSDAIDTITQVFRLDRQTRQNTYIEVWCEKDALSNVLYRVTGRYSIPMMINRGYSSCTAMHDAYERIRDSGKDESCILYLGDHDPSGLDMIRDVEDRLNEFGVFPEVVPIALTYEQIETYNPPPNPAKKTDPRSSEYLSNHGGYSWEVDALPPNVLHEIVEHAITTRMNMATYREILATEKEAREELVLLSRKMRG